MAMLVLQDGEGKTRSVELHAGLNRIGRGEYCDMFIDHASVSSVHCEIVVEPDGMRLRDLGSTNGTFVDGQRVRCSPVQLGQTIFVGTVAVQLRESEVRVVIPAFRDPIVPPVLKTPSGKDVCVHHDDRPGVWKCSRCGGLLCVSCIHAIRRHGGQLLHLCPDCSGPCEVLPEYQKKAKGSWLGRLKEKLAVPRGTRRRPR